MEDAVKWGWMPRLSEHRAGHSFAVAGARAKWYDGAGEKVASALEAHLPKKAGGGIA